MERSDAVRAGLHTIVAVGNDKVCLPSSPRGTALLSAAQFGLQCTEAPEPLVPLSPLVPPVPPASAFLPLGASVLYQGGALAVLRRSVLPDVMTDVPIPNANGIWALHCNPQSEQCPPFLSGRPLGESL